MKRTILILNILTASFVYGSRHLSSLPDTASAVAPAECPFTGEETSQITDEGTET